ncbi:MAG: hypothetical protein RLY16_751 [Bacteroidota bacterium]
MPHIALSQVSGTVFKDFNGNGVKDNGTAFNEPFAAGITVKATLINQQSFSTTTNATGNFSFSSVQIPAGTRARIEFLGFARGEHIAVLGTGNQSNVQFVKAPATSISAAVSSPDDYWNNIADPDPALLLVQEPRGTYNGYNAGKASVLHLKNSTNGPSPATSAYVMTIDTSRRPARYFNTGAIFGLAYQKKQERFFVSAILKRTFGFGTQGPGGVYYCTKSGATWAYGGGFNLQGVTPNNNAVALDFGSVTRVTNDPADDNYISGSQIATSKSRDLDAFAKVATMSIGGLETNQETDSIYLINLFQKRLVVIDGHLAAGSYNNPTAATLASITHAYDLASIPGYPTATGIGNNLRPFGIKFYKGRGYLGVVSDAMNTQAAADLIGYVLSFDPGNLTAGFTTEITIQFNLFRGDPTRVFRPWVTNWTQAGGTSTTNPKFCAQPIISDFEFNEDGSMTIGIRDRWGDQNAMDYDAWPGATNAGLSIEQGDILHACKVGSQWVLEGSASSCYQVIAQGNPRVAPYNPAGYGNSYNNTGREYYGDVSGDNENESAEGTLAKLMGSQTVVTSTYDPIDDSMEPNGNYWYTQGLHWNNVITGRKTQMARTAIVGTLQVSKTNGIGDIEFVTGVQPVQIGNLVWNDANGNGIQDAGENGIPNVAVILRSPGLDGQYNTADDQTASTTTDANGNYHFDQSNFTLTDTRKPSTWTAVNGILPGYDYRIEIDTAQIALVGFSFTQGNVSGVAEHLDNDGVYSGSLIIATFNTQHTNHDIDIGFKNLTSIAGYVWNDTNTNGLQDLNEFGIPGVVVNLYNAANEWVGSDSTDADGRYLITNVPPGSGLYLIFSNLPLGGSFTLQHVTGGNAGNDSEADPTGIIASITVLPGDQLTGFDVGIKGLNTLLPLRLISFTAAAANHSTLLQWTTAQEQAVRSIRIERSIDGLRFETIGSVVARGNAANNTAYSFTDYYPVDGTNFYRLAILHDDGTIIYSAIKQIKFAVAQFNIEVFPNPANQQINIALGSSWQLAPITITLLNPVGQAVYHQQYSTVIGSININTSQLGAGQYLLKTTNKNGAIGMKKIQVYH